MKKRHAAAQRVPVVAPSLLKLDLACGQRKQPGYHGVDRAPLEGVDTVWDLTQTPWPWADASVEAVYCSHFIEHLDGREQIRFMEELGRVLIPGGTAVLIAPYYTSMRAWQDPTHQRAICEASFLYYNKDWRVQNGLDHYPITCNFGFAFGYVLRPEIAAWNQERRDYAIRHYWNAVDDIQVTLTKQ